MNVKIASVILLVLFSSVMITNAIMAFSTQLPSEVKIQRAVSSNDNPGNEPLGGDPVDNPRSPGSPLP